MDGKRPQNSSVQNKCTIDLDRVLFCLSEVSFKELFSWTFFAGSIKQGESNNLNLLPPPFLPLLYLASCTFLC